VAFRIRRLYDAALPVDREAMRQVQAILRAQFPGLSASDIEGLPAKVRGATGRFRPTLLVAERFPGKPGIDGFALMSHEAQVGFCFLDYIAAARGITSVGIGGALYQAVRDEAKALDAKGLFFECLPDDAPPEFVPQASPKPVQAVPGEAAPTREEVLAANAARLQFYERWNARPIVGTLYTLPTPTSAPGALMPYLVYDGLERDRPLRKDLARQVVRAVLEEKYAAICPPAYVKKVVDSIKDDPVRLREPRYSRRPTATPRFRKGPRELIPIVVNDRHSIHHVRERGYVEAPVRIKSILSELEPTGAFERYEPREFPDKHIRAVHDPELVDYLRRACAEVPQGESVYPYVFPIRNHTRPPRDLSYRAGYFCIDTFTPINRNAYPAARRAVACALTAAKLLLEGRRVTYALVRPPGHHAERRSFGGFCYFNNAAVAAHFLSACGTVAILDVDYHHGNGQQEIFWTRKDVLTVSIHGHPRFAYPFFTGFEDERGAGEGEGFNVNIALPEQQDGKQYRKALSRALHEVRRFQPTFLIVCLGLDTAKRDPTGSWSLAAKDFEVNGEMIGALGLPTLVVQEGGYRTRTLGVNARHFFAGLRTGAQLR
jgi:acetoin utilization deacetylase AcuC-like enzyme